DEERDESDLERAEEERENVVLRYLADGLPHVACGGAGDHRAQRHLAMHLARSDERQRLPSDEEENEHDGDDRRERDDLDERLEHALGPPHATRERLLR